MPGLTKKQILIFLRLRFDTDVRTASKTFQEDYVAYEERYPYQEMTWAQLRESVVNIVLNQNNRQDYEENQDGAVVPTENYNTEILSLDPIYKGLPNIAFFANMFSSERGRRKTKFMRTPIPKNRVVVVGVKIKALVAWMEYEKDKDGEIIGYRTRRVTVERDFNERYDAYQVMTWKTPLQEKEEGWRVEILLDIEKKNQVDYTGIGFEEYSCKYSFQQEVADCYNIKDVLLRFTFFELSDTASRHWDSKTGQCVIDYLHYKFGNVKGLKKKMSIDNLKTELQELAGDHDIMKGISCNVILSFCRENNISVHVTDALSNKIDEWSAPQNNKLGSIVFKIQNDHIHPYEDRKLINKISQKQVYKAEDTYFSRLYFDSKVQKKDFTKDVKITFIDNETHRDFYTKEERGVCGLSNKDLLIAEIDIRKEVPPHYNIKNFQGNIQYVKFKDEIVYIDDERTAAKLVKEYYDWKGILWQNDTIFSIINQIFKEYDIQYSFMGFISHVFFSKFRTNRIHMGYADEAFYYMNKPDNSRKDEEYLFEISGIDIRKCYTHCVEVYPYVWVFFDIDSQWELFDENDDIHQRYMYEVETDNIKSFKGNGIYSYASVRHGLERGIIRKDDIKKKIRASRTQPSDYLSKLIKIIKEFVDQDYPKATELRKKMTNILVGLLGSFEKEKQVTFCTASKNDVIHYEQNYTKKFYTDVYDRQGLKLITSPSRYQTLRNNIPLNMQVIDYSNILLYELQAQLEQLPHLRVVYIYTDCAYVTHKKGQLSLDIKNMGREPGQYYVERTYQRSQFVQKVDFMCSFLEGPNRAEFPIYEGEECQLSRNIYTETTRNNTRKYVKSLLYNTASFMVYGKAGTGKTHLLENTIKPTLSNFDNVNYAVLSFTNVACGLINGMTLHTFFGILDEKNQLSQAEIERIKRLTYIIVDEISMVPKQFWCIFCQIRLQTDCSFIFLGDYRQCPPPEYSRISMLDTDTCTFIIEKNIVELTESNRYQESDKLYQFLEDIWDDRLSLSAIKQQMNKIDYIDETCYHICYTNKTRRHINIEINNMINTHTEIIKGATLFEVKEKILDETITTYIHGDARIYVGLQLISRKNSKKLGTFNSEVFTIVEIKEKTILLEAQRKKTIEELEKDDQQQKLQKFKQYQISVEKQDLFFPYFELAYCLTVYKWQGKTIPQQKNVTIHDLWHLMQDRRYLYTALSRVQKFKQLYLYENGSY